MVFGINNASFEFLISFTLKHCVMSTSTLSSIASICSNRLKRYPQKGYVWENLYFPTSAVLHWLSICGLPLDAIMCQLSRYFTHIYSCFIAMFRKKSHKLNQLPTLCTYSPSIYFFSAHWKSSNFTLFDTHIFSFFDNVFISKTNLVITLSLQIVTCLDSSVKQAVSSSNYVITMNMKIGVM